MACKQKQLFQLKGLQTIEPSSQCVDQRLLWLGACMGFVHMRMQLALHHGILGAVHVLL